MDADEKRSRLKATARVVVGLAVPLQSDGLAAANHLRPAASICGLLLPLLICVYLRPSAVNLPRLLCVHLRSSAVNLPLPFSSASSRVHLRSKPANVRLVDGAA